MTFVLNLLRATVVVPTRSSARTIEACLRSIKAQTMLSAAFVVDKGSSDGRTRFAQELVDLGIDPGPEHSAQHNRERTAGQPIVGFIDSDMIPLREVVEQPVAALEAGESVSATVMITRDQVSARPRSPATAESRA